MSLPPLPPGFVLEDEPQADSIPPLPPGFVMESDEDDGPGLSLDIVGGTPVTSEQFERENATDGMGGFDRFAAGVGKSIVDTGYGLKQAGTSMAEYFARQNPMLVSEETADGLQMSLDQQYAEQAEREKIDADLMGTGAGFAGNLTGAIGQIVGPGALLRGTSAAATFLPRTLAGNAVQGTAFGAAQPVASDGQRVANTAMGGSLGFAGAAAPRVIGAVAGAARKALPAVSQSAQTRAAADVLNQFAADPAALRAGAVSPEMLVAGSQPTLAEATGDVGLAGLQRTLANTADFGNALSQRQQANNLARVRAIEGAFGGADSASAEAIREARNQVARKTLQPIDKLPMSSLNKVVDGVQRLSEKHQASPAVRQAMAAVKDELPNIRTVGDAHAVRQYIGQLIGGQVEGKAGAKLAKRELMTVQTLLDREMRGAYPEWGKFLREYKAASREADRIDVGAELLATGRAVRSSTNDPSLTPAAFGRAAGNLDRTVQRATGFKKSSANATLTPEQKVMVDAVRRDLERYSRASTDGKAIGSNTVQNAIGGNSFQSAVGPVGAAMVEPISGAAMLGLNQMRAKFGGKVAGLVEEAMLDPARAAEILSAVPPSQMSEVLRAAAPLIARSSSVTGVVSPALTE